MNIEKHYDNNNHIYPLIALRRLLANQHSIFLERPTIFWCSVIKSSSAEPSLSDTHVLICKEVWIYSINTLSKMMTFTDTISLEMPVPSQGHYGFHSFPVVD